MTTTDLAAVVREYREPMEHAGYPVPDPEPGALLEGVLPVERPWRRPAARHRDVRRTEVNAVERAGRVARSVGLPCAP